MSWPANWPPLPSLLAILREHPKGCTRRDFEHLDADRPAGRVAIAGPGWINIQRRLIAQGHAEKVGGVLVPGSAAPSASAQSGSGPKTYTAPEIVAALLACGLNDDQIQAVGHALRNPAPPAEEAAEEPEEPAPTPSPADTDEIPD